jgi:hypothetical protein
LTDKCCRINEIEVKLNLIYKVEAMPAKKYIVRLSATERQQLKQLVKTGKVAAYKRLRAQILLKADIGTEGFGFKDKDIAASLDIAHRTVERTHQRSRALKLDGDLQAHLITLCCSEPPQGYSRWNLRLLAKTMVALDYVDNISPETVRQV